VPCERVGGVDLWYEVAGEGPPCLFVSGTGTDLRLGPTVLDSPLTAACTVLAYDHRGMGRSSFPDEPVTMATYADDAAALLEHLGWERCRVIGVSFGGMVAQELVLRRPELVERLVLCCTSSGGTGGASYPLHQLAELPPDERFPQVLGISDTRWDDEWQAAHPEAVEAARARQARADALVADRPDGRTAAAAQLEARSHHDTWDRLEQIAVPTLVCAGRYDAIAPPANAEALVSRIPGARLEWFEGGHLFLLQDPEAWPAIVRFLTED
jgi:3-oxoadipate enol-lactonase